MSWSGQGSGGGATGIDEGSFSRIVADGVRIAGDPFDYPASRALSLRAGENLWIQEEPTEYTAVDGQSTALSTLVVPGTVVLDYRKDGRQGRQVLLGLT